MILKRPITNIVILVLLLSGCRKHETEPAGPKPYLGGRVMLINSDTPVPDALVRFMKWQEGGSLFDPMVYEVVTTSMTDSNGHFDIPSGTDASMAIAYGLDSIFSHESNLADMSEYFRNGGEMILELRPPAWIRVSAEDVEPLNPEVHFLEGHPNTGSVYQMVPLATPLIWKVDGNICQNISYHSVHFDGSFSTLEHYDILPIAFDTIECIISY